MSKKNRKSLPFMPDCDVYQSGIYYILNRSNNRIYIGQTADLRLRLRRHFQQLMTEKHPNASLQQDWIAFGWQAFEFGFLTTFPHSPANWPTYLPTIYDFEADFIKTYQSNDPHFGYNLA